MSKDRAHLPLVYSCSGCSSAAQMANHLAVRLDREGVAEMSCIAGVGGNVRSLVRKARDAADAGRPIVAIDGCILACARSSLAERGVKPIEHIQLGDAGVRKRYVADFDPAQAAKMYEVLSDRVRTLAASGDTGTDPSDLPAPPLNGDTTQR